jgi:pimeloyl-ACP methyl ester carboxylesterase
MLILKNPFKMIRTGFFCLLLVFVALNVPFGLSEDDNLGPKLPTGLMQLPETKYPAFLYVPENYTPAKNYPFILAISMPGQSPEENMQFWASIAKRRSVIVMSPASLLRPGTEPNYMDEWILKLMSDIAVRYGVDRQRTYVVGVGSDAAHYASYLGVNYPDRFSGAALLGGSWDGFMEQMMHFSSDVRKQVPFFVAFESAADLNLMDKAKKQAMRLEQKGYLIAFSQLDPEASFDTLEFKGRLLDWLDQQSQDWVRRSADENKSWKVKFGRWLERNIQP